MARTNVLPADAPAWVTKDRQINELIYSCSFLSAHPMKCIHGRFFTVELLIPEDILTLQEYIRALLRLCRKRSI